MESKESEIILLATTIIIVLVVVFIVLLFTVFQKRKNRLLLKQEASKKRFEREIAETQIEIREQTLRNISWELHDNIGQLLTLAKIQLQNTTQESLDEVKKTISKSLQEIRALSKMINPEAIKNIKLKTAIQLEIDRLNRLDFIDSKLLVFGEVVDLDSKSEIIIFRILQEFLSNTIKHSRATELQIQLNYSKEKLQIIAKDNGVGFDASLLSDEKGIGLGNIKSRAKLIKAEVSLTSEKNKGTQLEIIYWL
jgi:signal transduction histidine kinase